MLLRLKVKRQAHKKKGSGQEKTINQDPIWVSHRGLVFQAFGLEKFPDDGLQHKSESSED